MISGRRRHFNDWVYWTQEGAFRIAYMIGHCFLKSYWINIDVFQIIYGILKVEVYIEVEVYISKHWSSSTGMQESFKDCASKYNL